MFPEPFGRPMVRRDEAMRGVHVPPPRGRGPGARTSRIVWIGGLIAAGLGVIAVTAFLIATGDDVEQGTPAGQGAAAVATDASTAVAGKSADGGPAVASSSSDKQGDPASTPPGDSKADAGATDDDKSAPGDSKAGDDKTASLDSKSADDDKDAGAADKTASADTKPDDKLAAADTTPDDKVPADTRPADKAAPADTRPADRAAPADTKPADKASADTKPADKTAAAEDKPVEDKPVDDRPAEDKPVEDEPAKDSETRRRPVSLITLQIDSLPRGAAVIRKKDGVRLGETPFTYETEPQSSPISVILRHKGYRDEHVSLPGNRSADRRIPLTRSRGSDRAPSLKD
jgi:hypothetical protein